jgi:hypothetical protein|tara:strand:+ start:795 stop:1649 length:855 start_codon:yes stop_codon:yes gene_type:complete
MKNNSLIFAKPPSNSISLEDCEFYHTQVIPGLSVPIKGEWDLRKGVDEYLGHVDFKNKTVLELGPASGYLTFHMEKLGGNIICIDLSTEKDSWDIVPDCHHNLNIKERDFMNKLKKVQNAFWYTHKALNSKAKVILSHVNDLPAEIGIYDISLMSSVILHLQNPFLGIQNMLRHTKEKAIITEVGNYKRIKSFRDIKRNLKKYFEQLILPRLPVLEFYPRTNNKYKDILTWWKISPEFIVNTASILGFEISSINYHTQYHKGHPLDMFTVVCERTVPIENCNYD